MATQLVLDTFYKLLDCMDGNHAWLPALEGSSTVSISDAGREGCPLHASMAHGPGS